MAKLGRGAVAYLGPNDDGAGVMEDFFNRIAHPALTDIRIDWGGMQVADVYPRRLPDLFSGRPVIVTGRITGGTDARVRVTGRSAGRPVEFNVTTTAAVNAARAAIPSVWARMKIADLADEATYAPSARIPETIKKVALDYSLMSAFTSFVAVDSSERTAGAQGVTVPVAVPVPEGVRYDTTVNERASGRR
jgi:Ca-activated chloride channel family protein